MPCRWCVCVFAAGFTRGEENESVSEVIQSDNFLSLPLICCFRFDPFTHSSPLISFSAEFDFRTYDREGVIFFAGGHLDSSWIVLAMHHGKLELQLKYGTVSRVTSSGPVVSDGQWRKVGGLLSRVFKSRLCLNVWLKSSVMICPQISVEEQGRSLVIKIDREAVMKIAVNGDLFTLKKGIHELNLTVGGVPFREDGLVNQVFICM